MDPRCWWTRRDSDIAEQRGYGDDVVLPDVSQRPEKRVAVRGNTGVSRLSRQRRTGNMAGRAPKGSCARSFDDHHRNAQTRNIKKADHAGIRCSRRRGDRCPVSKQALELMALLFWKVQVSTTTKAQ